MRSLTTQEVLWKGQSNSRTNSAPQWDIAHVSRKVPRPPPLATTRTPPRHLSLPHAHPHSHGLLSTHSGARGRAAQLGVPVCVFCGFSSPANNHENPVLAEANPRNVQHDVSAEGRHWSHCCQVRNLLGQIQSGHNDRSRKTLARSSLWKTR
jgi:hypothetical protein